MVGAMIIAVMKSAMPVMTWAGGMDWVPTACRSSARTMRMRTKHVVIRITDGTSVSTVSRTMMLSATERPPRSSESPPAAGPTGPSPVEADAPVPFRSRPAWLSSSAGLGSSPVERAAERTIGAATSAISPGRGGP